MNDRLEIASRAMCAELSNNDYLADDVTTHYANGYLDAADILIAAELASRPEKLGHEFKAQHYMSEWCCLCTQPKSGH